MIACCIVVEVVASAAPLFLCTHVHLKQWEKVWVSWLAFLCFWWVVPPSHGSGANGSKSGRGCIYIYRNYDFLILYISPDLPVQLALPTPPDLIASWYGPTFQHQMAPFLLSQTTPSIVEGSIVGLEATWWWIKNLEATMYHQLHQ